jgi:hypothetical protein
MPMNVQMAKKMQAHVEDFELVWRGDRDHNWCLRDARSQSPFNVCSQRFVRITTLAFNLFSNFAFKTWNFD